MINHSVQGKTIVTDLKICLVTETYPPEINGVAMTLGRLTETLVRQGNLVHLVRPDQGGEKGGDFTRGLKETLVRGIALPRYKGLRMGIPCGRTLRRIWEKDTPDLIHVATEGPLGFSAIRAANQLGIPVVSSYHTRFHAYGSHYGLGLVGRWAQCYLRWFHNKTLATYAPTIEMASQLEQDGFRNVRVLGRGVDTCLYSPAKRDTRLRSKWLGQGKGPIIIYVGRVAMEKNIDLAIKAFRRMKSVNPGSRYVIVGDGPLRKKLESENTDLIFCGVRRGEDLARHYASADIFLFPSKTETFGNVVTEAMASGLCVVAYDYAAAGQYIINRDNGFIVGLDNEEAFIETACQAGMENGYLKPLREKARLTALTLSWDQVVASYTDSLQGILSHQHVPVFQQQTRQVGISP